MPQGTYNDINRMGSVVNDPDYTVRLADSDSWLGGFYSAPSIQSLAEYLLHRIKGVTLGETTEYLEENGYPDIVVQHDTKDGETVNETFVWDTEKGDYTQKESDE